MPLETVCRQCKTRLRIQEEHLGRSIKCPACSAVVPSEDLQPAPAVSSPFATSQDAPETGSAVNPYASPQAPAEPAGNPAGADHLPISEGIRTAMRQTRPWVLFAAVLGFLTAGLMSLGVLSMIAVGLLSDGGGDMVGSLVGAGVYVLMGAVYFAGAYFLLSYGQRIGTFLSTNAIGDLQSALVAQKSFWKLFGIVTLVMIALGVVSLLGTVLFTFFAMSN